MAIPFNDKLLWNNYCANPDWHTSKSESASEADRHNQVRRVVNELSAQIFKQSFVRGVQFVRDAARLVLKVPIRSIWTPIILPKNWKELERSKINTKLTGYSFVQLLSVPVKVLVALAALATVAVSQKKAQCLLDKSESWTAYLDGRASQLEALKEVGAKGASNRKEYDLYRHWLYTINPKLCRKE